MEQNGKQRIADDVFGDMYDLELDRNQVRGVEIDNKYFVLFYTRCTQDEYLELYSWDYKSNEKDFFGYLKQLFGLV